MAFTFHDHLPLFLLLPQTKHTDIQIRITGIIIYHSSFAIVLFFDICFMTMRVVSTVTV